MENNNAFLLNALAMFFNKRVVERLSLSEIKKISLVAFGCKAQVIIKLTKLSIAINDLLLCTAPNGKGSVILAPAH